MTKMKILKVSKKVMDLITAEANRQKTSKRAIIRALLAGCETPITAKKNNSRGITNFSADALLAGCETPASRKTEVA